MKQALFSYCEKFRKIKKQNNRVDTDWKVRENSIIFRVVRESQGK